MARLTLLLFLGLIPSLLAQCTVEKAKPLFRRSVYEFSANLLTRVAQETENHFVASTLSAWTLLAAISLGAKDTTLAELKRVLQLENNKCFNNKFLEIATSITSENNLSDNSTDVILERALKIYVDDKLEISKLFKNRISRAGGSKFESISFEDGETAAQIVNDYVSRATHDTIDEIVSPSEFDDALMIMLDALYFKGSWQIPFPYEETEVSPFYNDRGIQIGDVNLMYLSASFKMRSINIIKATVIELPYGNDNSYSMLVFLPHQGVALYSVIEGLKVISLSTINKLLQEYQERPVSLQIPRFKITSDISNLKELLGDMGLKAMFDSAEARFPIISNYPLYVTNFIQKADIEVKEEGTIASAVSKADFGFRSSPDMFVANKPFLFMIIDNKLDVPIVTGAYSKPSLF